MNDDQAELVRLLPDPAHGRALEPERHAALRAQFLADIKAGAAPVAAPRRRRRRWAVAVPAVAFGLAIALWAGVAFSLGIGKFWAGRTDAGDLLARIAFAASVSSGIPPADQVRDDQWAFVQTYGGFMGMGIEVGPDGKSTTSGPLKLQADRRRIWLSVDGRRPGLLVDRDDPDGTTLDPLYAPSLTAPTFRYLTTLPTNPDVLLARIYRETWGAGPDPQQEAFVTIGDLMRESIVPPPLAEALYRAAARIPGITVVKDAVDALGRHGIAVARTFEGERSEWIFDRDTLQFLGERSVTTRSGDWGPAGTVTGSTAIEGRGFVDAPGRLP